MVPNLYDLSNLQLFYFPLSFPHRAEEVRKRHCEEKFVMDTLIFQKACARLEEAKAKADFIRTYYTSKSLKR